MKNKKRTLSKKNARSNKKANHFGEKKKTSDASKNPRGNDKTRGPQIKIARKCAALKISRGFWTLDLFFPKNLQMDFGPHAHIWTHIKF